MSIDIAIEQMKFTVHVRRDWQLPDAWYVMAVSAEDAISMLMGQPAAKNSKDITAQQGVPDSAKNPAFISPTAIRVISAWVAEYQEKSRKLENQLTQWVVNAGRQIVEIDYGGIEVKVAAYYHKDPTIPTKGE